MEKELKKAVAFIKLDIKNGFNDLKIKDSPALIYSIDCLISLAESFFSLKGFPEEKEHTTKCHFRELYKGTDTKEIPCECGADGYNQALQESKLWLLKKMDGIEDVVCNACNDCIDKTGGCAMLSNISKAIKDHLTK